MGNQESGPITTDIVEVDIDNLDVDIIDNLTKLIVYGYMHQIQKLLHYNKNDKTILNLIPLDIMKKCLFYYYENEYFKILGYCVKPKTDIIKIYDDARTISHQITNKGSGNETSTSLFVFKGNTSYGNVIIPSKIACTYKWYFKINQISSLLFIGISSNKSHHDEWLNTISTGIAYFYNPISDELYSKHPQSNAKLLWSNRAAQINILTHGDNPTAPLQTVMMEFDLKKNCLSFYRNGNKSPQCHIKNMESGVDITWNLAISIAANANISLIGFKKDYC